MRIHACVALLLLGSSGRADVGCPPDTVERVERTAPGRIIVCVTEKGLRNGPFRYVDESGVRLTVGQYERGLAAGPWQTWYNNGAKHEVGSYVEGKRSGWWTRWHSNGKKSEEGEYRADYEVGVWKAWDDQGRLVSEVPRDLVCPAGLSWRDAQPLIDGFPPIHGATDGRHCRRSDGVPQGPTVAWGFGRRKLAMVGSYCGGHAQGRWSFFWGNGVLAREGSYVGPSLKHGTWTDYDSSGRTLAQLEFAQGREVSRREFPRSREELPADPVAVDRLATERFEAAAREPCAAAPVALRPYLGLRQELRSADAVAVVRIVDIQMAERPPGWVWSDMPPPPQRVEAVVQKILAGSLGTEGPRVGLWLDAAAFRRRFETLPRYGDSPSFVTVQDDSVLTALVERNGERLDLLNVLAADEGTRTDALLTEYARLAALDDASFKIGLARHIADRIRLAPDRLLWAGWGNLALDDWSRQAGGSASSEPELQALLAETLPRILSQVAAFADGRRDSLNLDDLPWLIRLLAEPQRRALAAALLRVHPIFQAEVVAARRAFEKAHGPIGTQGSGMTAESIRLGFATGAMYALMQCLALCVDPTAAAPAFADNTLDRVRGFAGTAK